MHDNDRSHCGSHQGDDDHDDTISKRQVVALLVEAYIDVMPLLAGIWLGASAGVGWVDRR